MIGLGLEGIPRGLKPSSLQGGEPELKARCTEKQQLEKSWEVTAAKFYGCCLVLRVCGGVREDEGAVLLERIEVVGLDVGEGLRGAVGPDDFYLVDGAR